MREPGSSRPQYFRGEVWWADLNSTRGHEQAGRRPVLIISDDEFNVSPLEMAIVLPITKTIRRWPSRVPLSPPEGGILAVSEIACDQMRAISLDRLENPLGASVGETTLRAVERVLRALLGL